MLMETRLRQVLERAIAANEETGAALLVTREGAEPVQLACGMADFARGVNMRTDTICRVFSATKIVTAVAAMQLMERGLFNPDWALEQVIPAFAAPFYLRGEQKIPCSRSIRIRDLLNMTSGIPYPGDGNSGIDRTNSLWYRLDCSARGEGAPISTLAFAEAVAGCPLMFDVGETWMYGASADVLGAVISVLAKQPFGEYLQEQVFRPLGMHDTAFFVPAQKQERLAVLYENAGAAPRPYPGHNLAIYDVSSPPLFESGGAGLFSTAVDYSRLAAALANGGQLGGVRILGSETLARMTQNALTPAQRSGYNWDATRGYGYGGLVRMLENPAEAGLAASVGSFGWDGWTGTYVLCDPSLRLSIVLFLQRAGAGTSQLARNLVNAVYAALA